MEQHYVTRAAVSSVTPVKDGQATGGAAVSMVATGTWRERRDEGIQIRGSRNTTDLQYLVCFSS